MNTRSHEVGHEVRKSDKFYLIYLLSVPCCPPFLAVATLLSFLPRYRYLTVAYSFRHFPGGIFVVERG
jgi:hypothetical protein